MTIKSKKQFGVWMDSHHAAVVGSEDIDTGVFKIIGHVKSNGVESNSNEHTANNQKTTLTHKFFKEIMKLMPNVDRIHITGTGQIQEQFMKYLTDTAQYKNAELSDSTANKMSDEETIEFFTRHFDSRLA